MFWAGVLGGVLGGVLLVGLLLFVWRWSGLPLGDESGMTIPDIILIILGALEVALAALTALIAVAAIWGFAAIKQNAKDTAERAAREKTDTFLKQEESNIQQMIETKVDAEASGLYRDMEQSPTHDTITREKDNG